MDIITDEKMSFEKVAKQINDLTYTDFYLRLTLLARALFKWEGLPNGIDEKWIERYLYSQGACMFFHNDKFGYMVAKCTQQDGLNHYDEPVALRPVITHDTEGIANMEYVNYIGREIKGKGAVLIRNNDLFIPTARTIELYAYRLAEMQRTIDINVVAQRTPVLVKCSKKQELTLRNIYKQWDGNRPVIFGDKELDTGDFSVLKTDAPIVFDKLQIQKHALWNEVMTFLGINNANMDKRERLVDDEVQANNEQIELSASVMLKSREKACELINKLFPELKVKVALRDREEIQSILKEGVKIE